MLKLPNDIAPGSSPDELDDPEVEQDADVSEDPEMDQETEVPVEEPPPPEPDIPAGPDADDVVGDRRSITVYSVDPSYLGSDYVIGEAWQDEEGNLHGTGVCAMMIFEPLAKIMYKHSSVGMDVSPLTVLATRLSRGPFVRIVWNGDDDVPAE